MTPDAPAYRIENARAPLCLLAAHGVAADAEGYARVDIVVEHGRIAGISPAGGFQLDGEDLPKVDIEGRIVLPRLVDVHTHIDKGHIWPRRANPDGTFTGALASVEADREANWTANDVARRMDFSLRCALAHGTGALRTHIDSIGKQTAISWPVFAELREAWRDVITLQATALLPLDLIWTDEAQFREIVATVARYGGALGGVTYLGAAPDARHDAALDTLMQAAAAEGLDLDLHVDESLEPQARTLERIADAAIRTVPRPAILAGHAARRVPTNSRAPVSPRKWLSAHRRRSLRVNITVQTAPRPPPPGGGVAPLHSSGGARRVEWPPTTRRTQFHS